MSAIPDARSLSRELTRARAEAWLGRPTAPGATGALMDEYARAAEDFCGVVEAFDAAHYLRPHPQARAPQPGDPDTRTPQAICTHVVSAAQRYAAYILIRRGLLAADTPPAVVAPPASPRHVRAALAAGLTAMDTALAGLTGAGEQELAALRFTVRWGPVYDPDMLMEHAICHLLRHRRQLENWPEADASKT